MKKYLLNLGILATIISPTLVAISCGDKPEESAKPKPEKPTDQKPEEPTDPKPEEPTDPKPETPDDNEDARVEKTIDLTKMDSPAALINKMNEILNFKMKYDAKELIGDLDQKHYDEVDAYVSTMLQGIDNNNIKLVFNEKSKILYLEDLENKIKKMNEVFTTFPDPKALPVKEPTNLAMDIASSEKNPNGSPEMLYYGADLFGMLYGLSTAKFLKISAESFGAAKDPSNEDAIVVDIEGALARHPYLTLLSSWHEVIWDFVSDDIYKDWVGMNTTDKTDDKVFKLLPSVTTFGNIDTTNLILEEVKINERYDNISNGTWVMGAPMKHDGEYQTSNFEAQLLQTILNLEDAGTDHTTES